MARMQKSNRRDKAVAVSRIQGSKIVHGGALQDNKKQQIVQITLFKLIQELTVPMCLLT